MTDKAIIAAEDGTYSTTAPNPHVDLDGTFPSSAPLHQLFDTVLDSTDTCEIVVWKDETNWAHYRGVEFTSGTPDELDLNGGTLVDSEGAISNSDAVSVWAINGTVDRLVDGYVEDGNTSNLVSGGTLTVTLDGRVHEFTLNQNVTTWSVTTPTAPEVGSTIIIFEQAATAYTIAFPATWYWPDGIETTISTTDGDKLQILVQSTPAGDIHAQAMQLMVP